jgi:hypothetical protein
MATYSSFWLSCGLGLTTLAATGCTTVPPRDGLAKVHVGDVVKRIKCDVSNAVIQMAQEPGPADNYPYLFLSEWAAKIHLTIAIDDSVSLNPGATLTSPLDQTVATRLVPATTEFFSFGLGAGLTTEAIRTEDIEFLFSFPDVEAEFKDETRKEKLYNDCKFPNGLLLESHLGLEDLIRGALEPIKSGVLKPERNVGPGATPVPTPPNERSIQKQLEDLKIASSRLPEIPDNTTLRAVASSSVHPASANKLISSFGQQGNIDSKFLKSSGPPIVFINTITAITYTNEAALVEQRVQDIINAVVKPLYGIAASSLASSTCLNDITDAQFQAITYSANVSLKNAEVYSQAEQQNVVKAGVALQELKVAAAQVVKHTRDMVTKIDICSAQERPKKKKPTLYDPIDLISEQVNFNITMSGSATPGWKLVNVVAPLAPTMFSGSRKDTNTVILAMGRPNATADGGIAASTAMNNQILAAILSQAVTSGQRVGQ